MKLREFLSVIDGMELVEVFETNENGNLALSKMGLVADFLKNDGMNLLNREIDLVTEDIKKWQRPYEQEPQDEPFICILLKND